MAQKTTVGPMLGTLIRYVIAWIFTLSMSALACLGLLGGSLGAKIAWLVMCRPWAVWTLRILNVRVNIVGRHNLVGPALFASNHQALIDIIFLPAILPKRVKWVAKRELLKVPLWGWALSSGAVFIDRQDPRSAAERIRQGVEGLPADWSICIFPEGTRSRDGVLGPFKTGVVRMALRCRLPVVPMAFHGAHRVNPHKHWLVQPGTIELTIGDPINTEHWSEDRIHEHVALVRECVQRCLDASRARAPSAPGPADQQARDLWSAGPSSTV